MRKNRDMKNARQVMVILALLGVVGAAAAQDGMMRHSVGVQPFIIPLTSGTSGDLGTGFAFDYEFRLDEQWGVVAGYLKAKYEEELTYYGTYGINTVRHEYDDVSIGGPVVGMRFHSVPPFGGSENGDFIVGGSLGFWSKEDDRRSDPAESTDEDVVAVYVTLAYRYTWKHLELGYGADVGGITGDDAGLFVTSFLRLGCRF